MVCEKCGGEVIWKGPFSNLTHTECQKCGGLNCQVVEPEYEEDLEYIDGIFEDRERES